MSNKLLATLILFYFLSLIWILTALVFYWWREIGGFKNCFRKMLYKFVTKVDFFSVAHLWFRLGGQDKIATNGFLHVKPWKKYAVENIFDFLGWSRDRKLVIEIAQNDLKKWFFANYWWTGNHQKKRNDFMRSKFG